MEIWGGCPPRSAHAALHVYVSQLRKFLGRRGVRGPIVTRAPGYALALGGDTLDVRAFQALMDRGRRQLRAGQHEVAAETLQRALDHWRGGALFSQCDGPILTSFGAWLEEARLECVELLIESKMAMGRYRELVGFLTGLIDEYPLREGFYRLLMTVLCRCERRADAVRVFRSACRTLNDELGLEPGRALREAHQVALAADDLSTVD
ncbi:AfsR/SARP family transcriptional regulator [Kutzneria sp. CA-103260]|uniref:AfsR/SARP family transcriptional regulator n=1 Tax=Kutzneria sp. CA-103260 TaxID=2802641 RepID=UPI002012012E|nr:AfsR/SARP family transcriptional regulator [Kutzneria sp. CA-103260]